MEIKIKRLEYSRIRRWYTSSYCVPCPVLAYRQLLLSHIIKILIRIKIKRQEQGSVPQSSISHRENPPTSPILPTSILQISLCSNREQVGIIA